MGYDHIRQEYFRLDFEEIPVRFPGTGDIFSSVFMGKIMEGCDLNSATLAAMHVAFPYVDILRYGGEIPNQPEGTAVFSCPDVDTLNIFKIERVDEEA